MAYSDYTKVTPAADAQVFDLNNPPKRLSDAINLALDDLELTEASEGYFIDMSDWHAPFFSDTSTHKAGCYVCFAGAVMAQRLDADPTRDIGPGRYGATGWEDVLHALNHARAGYIRTANAFMKNELMPATDCQPEGWVCYEDDPAAFKVQMREVAANLAKAGN